jgi:hypothetical protein
MNGPAGPPVGDLATSGWRVRFVCNDRVDFVICEHWSYFICNDRGGKPGRKVPVVAIETSAGTRIYALSARRSRGTAFDAELVRPYGSPDLELVVRETKGERAIGRGFGEYSAQVSLELRQPVAKQVRCRNRHRERLGDEVIG